MTTEFSPTLAELRRLSNEFRRVASRALRSNHQTARPNLLRLQAFVSANALLSEAVRDAPAPEADVLEDLRQAQDSFARLPVPLEPEEELGYCDALIRALAESDKDLLGFVHYYAGKSGLDEPVKALLDDIVDPYVSLLNERIERLLIEHPTRRPRRRGSRSACRAERRRSTSPKIAPVSPRSRTSEAMPRRWSPP